MFDVAEGEGFDFDDHPFAATWNGATWKAAGLPVPGGTMGNILTSVSCAVSPQRPPGPPDSKRV